MRVRVDWRAWRRRPTSLPPRRQGARHGAPRRGVLL